MQTSPACFPCFQRQIRQAVGLVARSTEQAQGMITAADALLADLDPRLSPPENAVAIYALIATLAGQPDPFSQLKSASTRQAVALRSRAGSMIDEAPDPLNAALRLAIAGNIMDYGALQDFDVDAALANCLGRPLALDDSAALAADLGRAKTVLYLADNCGELVFDGLLIERLANRVTLAVKDRPAINDATLADARDSRLPVNCRVITNGTGCPGTPLASCSPAFREAFGQADLIVSKGQGNFETLSDIAAPIYYLLTVKCQTVARHLEEITGCRPLGLGDLILLNSRRL